MHGLLQRSCPLALASSALVTILGTSGCRHRAGPFDEWIRAEDQQLWIESSSSAWHLDDSMSGQDASADPSFHDKVGPEHYVEIALQRSPAVRAAEQRVAAVAQRIPQATSLDDPMLEVAPIGEMAETAAGMVGVMTGVSQRFPLGGKLSAAGHLAEAEVAAAIADLETVRLRVANDVRQAYWRYYESARALEALDENRDVLEQLSEVSDARYRSGGGTQQDVLRATTELSEIDAQRMTIERQIGTAQSMLNQLMDRAVDAALPSPAPADLETLSLELDDLITKAMSQNPALRQISADIEAERQRVRLARAQRVPDLNVSFAYNFVDDEGLSPVANGDDQWWVGFGINLPIWKGRLDAAEREARLNELRAISTLANERNATAYRVRDAVLAAETARRRAALIETQILPQARQTLDASLAGYRTGGVDFLTLADNWRRVLEFQLMLHENIAEVNRALADLEATVGESIQLQKQNANGGDATLSQTHLRPASDGRGGTP